ncbi:MAG: 16S rRNA (guanine(966)-N(2))-methyltransferase RsmD [Putridiphycobacter sp.]|nr:16S rRNA (guanine(966)-N(2))-methyltransferase RsmD [Putridiphycobacter sp.]
MRIIRGKYRSRRFSPPKNFPSRPTTDYAKESLFNILENRIEIEGLDVLDLFAGTGNISLEFLSRGATAVTSIDQNYAAYKYMKTTQHELAEEGWQILKQDVFKMIPKLTGSYSLIFADPPFGLKGVTELPTLIIQANLLKPEGDLIIEHGQETDFSNHPNFKDIRKYGGVNFSFFNLV